MGATASITDVSAAATAASPKTKALASFRQGNASARVAGDNGGDKADPGPKPKKVIDQATLGE
jgi:hypothetical protein